jgi:hypothetical protein
MQGTHWMIDLETLDTEPTAVIVSVGVAMFSKENGIFDKQYWVLDWAEQAQLGRTINPNTVAWWMNQTEQARNVFNTPESLRTSLPVFANQFKNIMTDKNTKMWGNGSDFDNVILMNMWHKQLGVRAPWKYSNNRCYRTFKARTNCQEGMVREGTHHNALDDAIFQAQCVLKVL